MLVPVGVAAFAQAAPPESGSGGVLLAVLIALLTGSLGTVLFNIYRQRQVGQAEKEDMFAAAELKAVDAARGMLSEYREELTRAKDEIRELREKLEESNQRIAALEALLTQANSDRDRLQAELTAAIEKRGAMAVHLEELQMRISVLESVTTALPDPPAEPEC